MMELQQSPTPEVVEKLHAFADVVASDSIIVTVVVQPSDKRSERAARQAINRIDQRFKVSEMIYNGAPEY
jgi:hypothetical protein